MHQPNIPETIRDQTLSPPTHSGTPTLSDGEYVNGQAQKVKRTPKNLYQVRGPSQESTAQDESTPLLKPNVEDPENPTPISRMPEWEPEGEANSTSRIVSVAIYVNLAANTILLILKIIVVILSSSVSVLASMVDAALDFLSTAIVFVTTRIINRKSAHDREKYPVGRRKLEPIGVLVFSVIMVTAFVQVAIEGFGRLTSGSKEAVQLSTSAIVIMACTVGIKGLCWVWCKAIKNSSVQALAQDAMTDVIFNIFSIIFPLSTSFLFRRFRHAIPS